MKYTYKDVIFSLDDPRAKEAEGKEVYWGTAAETAIGSANDNWWATVYAGPNNDENKHYAPFALENGLTACFIIVKKGENSNEPKNIKRVPFDLSKKEDRDALKGRWIGFPDNHEDDFTEMIIGEFDHFNGKWFINHLQCDAEELLKNHIFLDGEDAGQPVGKIVEEDD